MAGIWCRGKEKMGALCGGDSWRGRDCSENAS